MLKTYSVLSALNLIMISLAMGGTLAIAWIGWLRTRRLAYLILVAWALATLVSYAMSWAFWPVTQKMSMSQEASLQLNALINLGSTIVRSLLLLAGLGLLVFSEPPQTPAP
jgi:hypothetical protein